MRFAEGEEVEFIRWFPQSFSTSTWFPSNYVSNARHNYREWDFKKTVQRRWRTLKRSMQRVKNDNKWSEANWRGRAIAVNKPGNFRKIPLSSEGPHACTCDQLPSTFKPVSRSAGYNRKIIIILIPFGVSIIDCSFQRQITIIQYISHANQNISKYTKQNVSKEEKCFCNYTI